jgi:flavin reductase (DIM6/NTAB) family NADH-FMN oxidoreductase RutF
MYIDTATTKPHDNYKLMINLVVPRAIAWVTSQNAEGVVNLAPFSFFNAICGDPPHPKS